MTRVYACLLGDWIDITNTGTIENESPLTYITEELGNCGNNDTFKSFQYDYVNIQYNRKNYRIHPAMIQIVR